MAQNQRNARAQSSAPEQPALLPPVDVIEDASGITLYADLPGVPKDKLSVRIDGENLVIDGEIALEMAKNLEATHVEVSLPRYRRVFTLSKELDPAVFLRYPANRGDAARSFAGSLTVSVVVPTNTVASLVSMTSSVVTGSAVRPARAPCSSATVVR